MGLRYYSGKQKSIRAKLGVFANRRIGHPTCNTVLAGVFLPPPPDGDATRVNQSGPWNGVLLTDCTKTNSRILVK
jgi:hypothetical protein